MHADGRVRGDGPRNGNGGQLGHIKQRGPGGPARLGVEILRVRKGQEMPPRRGIRGEHGRDNGIDPPLLRQELREVADMALRGA